MRSARDEMPTLLVEVVSRLEHSEAKQKEMGALVLELIKQLKESTNEAAASSLALKGHLENCPHVGTPTLQNEIGRLWVWMRFTIFGLLAAFFIRK